MRIKNSYNRNRKHYWRWLIWVVVFGGFYYMGHSRFQMSSMNPFLLVMVAIPFLILGAFWVLRDKADKAEE